MSTIDKIQIANLKCSGCENTIKTKLSALPEVMSVSVDQDTATVTIEHGDATLRSNITTLLHSLGYPEATEENGLLLKAKSYASCMIGRLS